MKKILILPLLLILTLTPIIGYKVVSANTEVTQNKDTITIQQELESYFKSYDYTLDNPNIITNPYKISPLTALVIFETPKETPVTVTVEGKDQLSTYQKTYPKSKEHYIEVLGLYPNYENKVTIKTEDEEKTLTIKTDPLPQDLTPQTINNPTNKLYFITTDTYTYALDNNNEVRWYLTKNYTKKITRLDNGNLLLSTDKILKENINTGLVEIDLLGKIHNEYNIDTGYYGSYAIKDNNILILSKNLLEIDKQTGQVITEFPLDKTYTQVSYQDNIITLTNNEETLKINYQTKEYQTTTPSTQTEETSILIPLYTDKNYTLTTSSSFNTATETKESKDHIFLINYKKIDENYQKYNINIIKEANKLIISGNFTSSDKVYIILDKFLDKKIYDINPTSNITYKYILGENLQGKYSIYIKINDIIYKTDKYVSF